MAKNINATNNSKPASKEVKNVLSPELIAAIAQVVAVEIAKTTKAKSSKKSEASKETIKDCPLKVGDVVKSKLGNICKITAIVSATEVRADLTVKGKTKNKHFNVSSLTKVNKSEIKKVSRPDNGRLELADYVKAIVIATYGADDGMKKFAKAKDYNKLLSDTKKYRKEKKLSNYFTVDNAKQALDSINA